MHARIVGVIVIFFHALPLSKAAPLLNQSQQRLKFNICHVSTQSLNSEILNNTLLQRAWWIWHWLQSFTGPVLWPAFFSFR